MRRIALEVDDELFKRTNELLPWGSKAAVLRTLLELIVEGTEKHGDLFIGALLSGRLVLQPRKEERNVAGQKD